MATKQRTYVCIDLKSFYASAECVERGLDPMGVNLVVADGRRTQKTICLAVSPTLKAYGISGRARLFEVVERVREINAERRRRAPGGKLRGASFHAAALAADPSLALGYIAAPPRMGLYIQKSTEVYAVYLKYVCEEDMHVYSIDEVFIDVTGYLRTYGMTARELTSRMIADVRTATGITAAAGIGSNLYLAKVAMDILAKRAPADENGVRIAELDEAAYRRELWAHQPLRDFWRVGRGYAQKLAAHGLFTMGDIARCSLCNEALLYRLFGVNAELLIDHAWGWEPCTMAHIKAYRPRASSTGSGQVLTSPYPFDKARLVVREMAEALALDLTAKGCLTDQLVLHVGYDVENLTDPERRARYHGAVTVDLYGRAVPKAAHGTVTLPAPTASVRRIAQAVLDMYDRIVAPELLVRRLNVTAAHLADEAAVAAQHQAEQLDLFTDYAALEAARRAEAEAQAQERSLQHAMLAIRQKYGKNAIFKAASLLEGATARERNGLIGGHKA